MLTVSGSSGRFGWSEVLWVSIYKLWIRTQDLHGRAPGYQDPDVSFVRVGSFGHYKTTCKVSKYQLWIRIQDLPASDTFSSSRRTLAMDVERGRSSDR